VADDFLDDVLKTILEWTPQTEYSTETKYRDDLLECLKKNLNSETKDFTSTIWGLEHSGFHYIKKEAGRGLVDIGIDNEIGIELKRNFKSKTQMNRPVGQVVDYLISGYLCVIIVLCGKTDQEAFDTLKHNLKQIFKYVSISLGEDERIIKIITKSKPKRLKKRKLSSICLNP
jgi:hypothetical protein